MTESERVARELLAYRDNPPVRQAGLVEGQWYESVDILWIIMAPRCEFTTYELLTRLAELMGRGTCRMELSTDMEHVRCTKCGYKVLHGADLTETRFCGGCGRRVEP